MNSQSRFNIKPIEHEGFVGGIQPVSNLLFGGLLLFFLFEYARPGSYFPFLEAAKINTLIPVSVFVLTLFSISGRSNWEILSARNTKWLLFFLLLFPIQVFTADVTFYVYDKFKGIIGYLLIYFVIIRQVTSIQRIKMVFSVLIFVHVLLVFLNPNLVLTPETRSYIAGVTFLGDGNDFAWSACIIIPFALFLAQETKSKIHKFIYFGTFFLLTLTVVGTQSRGGSIALGASLIYLSLKVKRKAVGLMGLGAVVGVVLLFAPQAYFDRIVSMKDYETEGSAQGRILAWKSAVRMAVDNPLTGVGAGHFPVKFGLEYRPPGIGRTEMPWLNAHSIYFVGLGEFGFSGAFFLLGIILSNLLRNERNMRKKKQIISSGEETHRKLFVAMQASLIGFAVGGVFLSGLYYPHLYIVIALCEVTSFVGLAENHSMG